MNVTSVDFSMDAVPLRQSSTASIGRIKPELYKQKSVDSEDGARELVETCGKLSFSLRYNYEDQALVVRILKALELPAKDFTGTSDPYVKIYLLPERKKKFQTRVHRKNLNPTFDETFCFPVAYDELCNRKLHFSVYDFDRFTSHDMIGEVVVDNLFELSDLSREAVVWKDIHAATTVSRDVPSLERSEPNRRVHRQCSTKVPDGTRRVIQRLWEMRFTASTPTGVSTRANIATKSSEIIELFGGFEHKLTQ